MLFFFWRDYAQDHSSVSDLGVLLEDARKVRGNLNWVVSQGDSTAASRHFHSESKLVNKLVLPV